METRSIANRRWPADAAGGGCGAAVGAGLVLWLISTKIVLLSEVPHAAHQPADRLRHGAARLPRERAAARTDRGLACRADPNRGSDREQAAEAAAASGARDLHTRAARWVPA